MTTSGAMKVAVYPDDDGGCGHNRLIWPGRALADQGADVTVYDPAPGLMGVMVDDEDGVPQLIDVDPPDADVVVIQRPLRIHMAQAIPILQAKGRKVVVDIDDDFGAIHPRNVSFPNVHPRLSPHRNHQILHAACSIADHVICTTPALAQRYGRHGRVTVVPNQVPAWYLTVERPPPHERMVVGWTGSIETHPTDLQATGGAVARLVRGGACAFAVVGTGIGVGRALGLAYDPPGTGWLELEDYPRAMAEFDVGIVPLDDIAFNEAKSSLKAMEFAALGVPVVASATPDNVRMAMHGVCILASRRREWERELYRLVTDADARAEQSARGREAMAAHTIEGNAQRWWDAWTAPIRTRRNAA